MTRPLDVAPLAGLTRLCAPVLILVGGLFLGSAAAAQGNSRAGGASPTAGSAQAGGTTAAANRGGAGGIANPAPGGSPALIGESRHAPGPRSTETTRSGYVGGRPTGPDTPPDPEPPPVSEIAANQFGKCPSGNTQSARNSPAASEPASGRTDLVASYLNRDREPAEASTARYLIANLREELQKENPDSTLAGTYLGIASAMPVTPALVSDLGAALCLQVPTFVSQAVAATAETQRNKLISGGDGKPQDPAR